MGATSAAFAASAAASSAAATAAANEARRAQCAVLMPNYSHKTATAQESREYASCVQFLAPVQIDPTGAVLLKIVIALALLAIPVGGWVGSQSGDIVGTVLGALIGPTLVGLVAFALFAIVAGIAFIFS